MASVLTDNVECPVCGASTAHSDVDIHTNERDFNCVRCGFYSVTESVERAGKKFWKVTMEMPVSKDGRVAWPELVPITPQQQVETGRLRRHAQLRSGAGSLRGRRSES